VAMLKALRAVIHHNVKPEEAQAIFETARSRKA